MRAIIIEDELLSRSTLEELVGRYCPQIEIVATCKDGLEGKEAILRESPDLIFLDIEMPNMNGFEMLDSLDETDFDIIFTTAYDEFAVKAFKVSAMDYLLKPIDEDELMRAVRRVSSKQRRMLTREHVDILLTNIKSADDQFEKIAIPSQEGLDFVDVKNIVRCEADRNYTTIYVTSGDTFIFSKTLKEFEKFLPEELFFRPHHSHLINLEQISKYIRGMGGEIVLKDGTHVPVSRSKKDALMKRIFKR
ncbi:MAG: LytTR family DNA-binding domain-containing protein [Saprospiraceae bacterium]|nr:LytTR family DNA-binding domain-containing protein [Saprospiraceae bacterium]